MIRRIVALFATAIAIVLVTSSAAFAHVHVEPSTVAAGATVDLAFHVPSEEPNSPTTKVEVFIPPDAGVTVADAPTLSGWSPTITRDGDVVTSVAWSAGSIAPNQVKDFPLTLQVPTTTDRLVLKTLQTYQDGTVVRWIDESVTGAAEPEHPAPVLTITGATTTTSPPTTLAPTTTVPPGSEKSTGNKVGEILIGVGILAIVFAYMRSRALARRRAGAARRRR